MMQNSPFLVTQASPVKNATTPKQHSEKAEQGQSFKQVLSKQVEQEEAKSTQEKSSGDNANTNVQAKDENKDKQASLMDTTVVSVEEADVDAQLLASEVTAKTLEDVTDGEVVLEAMPETDASQLSMASMMPAIQPTTKTARIEVVPKALPEKALVQTKQGTEDVGLDKAIRKNATQAIGRSADQMLRSDKEALDKTEPVAETIALDKATKDEAALVKEQSANLSLESDKKTNAKFANYLVGEKNANALQEASAPQSASNSADASGLMAMQSMVKPLSQPVPTAGQVGFSNLINASPGKAGWSEAIGQKVVWMVGASEQSATLTLNPKDLGPLQVIINVNNEKADATFISENPEVRKALEEGMSSLRQSMGQAGVELGQANVNTSKQHQDFQQASKGYAARKTNEAGTSQGADSMSNMPMNTRASNGLVDTFV